MDDKRLNEADDLKQTMLMVRSLKGVTEARKCINDPSRCESVIESVLELRRSRELLEKEDLLAKGRSRWVGPRASKAEAHRTRFEEAVQRTFRGEVVRIDRARYQLFDSEFPTRPNAGGIDLLGMPLDAESSDRAIVELKYMKVGTEKPKGSADSPVSAVLQAAAYARDASIHKAILCTQTTRTGVSGKLRFPDGWRPFLVVAANSRYWAHWLGKLDNGAAGLVKIGELLISKGLAHEVSFVEFDDFARKDEAPQHGDPAGLEREEKRNFWRPISERP